MRDTIRRRRKSFLTIFTQGGGVLFLFAFIGVLILTVLYTLPNLFSSVFPNKYVSPLAKTISLRDALEGNISTDEIKNQMKKTGFAIDSVAEYDNTYKVVLEKGREIIFSKKKPLKEQISSLQLISGRLTIEGKDFRQIDMRFDRPVITPK